MSKILSNRQEGRRSAPPGGHAAKPRATWFQIGYLS
jgi:hypothetical protein